MNTRLINITIIMACLVFAGCVDTISNDEKYHECLDSESPYFCTDKQVCCQGECTPISEENCGACGKSCKYAESCLLLPSNEWGCACTATGQICSGACCPTGCFDLSNNAQNCGVCGNACQNGQICNKGICSCPSTLTLCGTACVDLQNDAKYCGNCNNACVDASDISLNLEFSQCKAGKCDYKCANGFRNNDGNILNGCESPSEYCGNNQVEGLEECDGYNFDGKTCQSVKGVDWVGQLICNDCVLDTSSCRKSDGLQQCSNDITEGTEICDGTDINGATCESVMGAEYTGTLKCKSDCSGFDTTECTKSNSSSCNNGSLDNGEACDGTKFKDNKTTCQSYDAKYVSGNLKCTTSCSIDFSECAECNENDVKCDGATLKTCTNKSWNTQKCTGTTPKCSESGKKCVECLNNTDCTSQNCNTSTGTCQSVTATWTTILENNGPFDPPSTSTNPGYVDKPNTLKTKGNTSNGLNIGPWPTSTTPDFTQTYIVYDLSSQLSKLTGKSMIGVTFDFNINAAGPKYMAVAFFCDGNQLGTQCGNIDTATALKTMPRCEVAYSSCTSSLEIRVVGYETQTSGKGTLRFIPPFKFEAK